MRLTHVKVHQKLYGKANVLSELEADVRINEMLRVVSTAKWS